MVSWYLSLASSVLSAVAGAWLVYFFGLRQLAAQRRLGFAERQLAEFYAPLVAIQKQIRAKSDVRAKVSEAANQAWQEECQSRRASSGASSDDADPIEPYKKMIEYGNQQLKDELLPAYRQMLDLFTGRYHLADPETRAFYEQFLEFVEIWNRWLSSSLPASVLKRLNHKEAHLKPFYEHLEEKLNQLQGVLKRG